MQGAGLIKTSEDWPSFRVGGATFTVGVYALSLLVLRKSVALQELCFVSNAAVQELLCRM